MTHRWQRIMGTAFAAVLLAGCGTETASEPSAPATAGGDEPLTARALAAVIAEHTGKPSSARVGHDLADVSKDVAAEVELTYPVRDTTDDGDQLTVGVGTGFEKTVGGCRSLTADNGYAGCVKTSDGQVFWEKAVPEEDPGVVYVMVSKGDTDVLLFYSGPRITGDPRKLDLSVSVQDMLAVGNDPRVDVTTSAAAVAEGDGITFWQGPER